MKRRSTIYEAFMPQSQRPMEFGALPVQPKEPEAPVFAVDRWKESDGALYKTYRFRRMPDRDAFVVGLLAYEADIQHHAELRIEEAQVDLRLQTRDIGKATEIDKEYARYADVLFKDLVYRQGV